MRGLAAAAGVFALVLAVLLAAVGQLGKIDRQTLVVVLASAAVAAVVAAVAQRRKDVPRDRE
jgi:peptidoglycan/LPS O-acetylase OafA/YrhL